MTFVDKYFWLIAIGVTLANFLTLRSRSKAAVARNPELKEGYEKLFRGYLIYTNIPWVLMGVGILAGSVDGVFDYLNPRFDNPYVVAFHLSMIVLWILSILWIYFRGGAEFLVEHPGLISGVKSPLVIKVLFALMLLAGFLAMASMWLRLFHDRVSPS